MYCAPRRRNSLHCKASPSNGVFGADEEEDGEGVTACDGMDAGGCGCVREGSEEEEEEGEGERVGVGVSGGPMEYPRFRQLVDEITSISGVFALKRKKRKNPKMSSEIDGGN